MSLKIYDDSKNYTAIIVRPKISQSLPGLDNLVGVSVFGNLCLVPKSYDLMKQYVFFPAETQLSPEYLSGNNMYREPTLNADKSKKGYFEDNGRVKALKLKGTKSTGLLMPIESLQVLPKIPLVFMNNDEFNEVNGTFVCKKYIVPSKTPGAPGSKIVKVLDSIVDSKQFPEHIDTDHLLKYLNAVSFDETVIFTIKLHGTSGRVGNILTKRKLNWKERLAKKLGITVQEEEYKYVAGSRRVVKSVAFGELKGKQHFYDEDLWTKVAKNFFSDKLNKGEMVYFEVVGKDYTGSEIQSGYSYGYSVPVVYIYRITNINAQGIEIDLPWNQVKERAIQLGVQSVYEVYQGSLQNIVDNYLNFDNPYPTKEEIVAKLEQYLKDSYMDKRSIFDDSVFEEGIVVRYERYGKPKLYKMKAPEFLLHEGKQADKQIVDLETANS